MPNLSTKPSDVAIIGSGIIGLSLAWRLAQNGLHVTVFGPESLEGTTSYWAAGMLSPCCEAKPTEERLLAFNLQAKAAWPQFVDDLHSAWGQSVGYRSIGTVHVAITEDERARLTHTYNFQKSLGLPLEPLSHDGCLEREPYLSPRITQGVFSPEDHQVDPRLVLQALTYACKTAGVQRVYTKVEQIEFQSSQITRLMAQDTWWTPGHTVIAAGVYSSDLPGLPPHLRPPLHPVKGQSLMVHMNPHAPLCRHVIRGCGIYMVPHTSGRLVIGATSEEKGFDEAATFGAHLALMEAAWRLFPGIEELALGERGVGFRPGTRDGAPILGPSSLTDPIPNLTYATGHYRHGILMAPLTAQWLTQWICDHHLPENMASFSLERFHAIAPRKIA
jgi:glycine oxidase